MPARRSCSHLLSTLFLASLLGGMAEAQTAGTVSGIVRDVTGAVVPQAEVSLLTARQNVVGSVKTDAEGRFRFTEVHPGSYLLVVSFPGFTQRRLAIVAGQAAAGGLVVTLEPEGVRHEVTVTASPGVVQETRASAQPVNVIDARDIDERAKAVVAQIATEETGVHLLRTAPVMAGIYVRGLTGNKVNVFVDGVRYSTSSARGGVNTFLDLIEPTNLEAVEILRGPNSAQYGSDAIGGSVQFLSPVPTFSAAGTSALHGLFAARGNSADQSFGGHLTSGYSTGSFGLLLNLSGRRINNVRAGDGIDSHAAVTRFLGLRSDVLMPDRLPDTAFTQYGGLLKINWAPTPSDQLIVYYTRDQQDGGKRYDQLLGGDGNLIADLRNLMLDLGYVKYNRVGAGWFDQLTAVYSFNRQREERVNQGGNGNPKATITHEYERTTVSGFQGHLAKHLSDRQELALGGEFYPEQIRSPSFGEDPVTGATYVRRGRVPDKARYRSGGVYAQDVIDLTPRLRLTGNLRYSYAWYESKASDSPIVDGQPLWPDDSFSSSSITFRVGAVASVSESVWLSANIGRGFRAPHMTDLGTVGLTGSGYQVSADTVEGMGAEVGSTAGATAASTGRPVEPLRPETSMTYEAGLHYRGRRFGTDLALFLNDIFDSITYQALILPPGAVGTQLGDQTITDQNANGVVYVPAASNPVLVRTNFGDARIWGIEHTFDWQFLPAWSVSTVFTYIRAKDPDTGLPPNIEGGTPAPDGYLKIRYIHPSGRFWVMPYVHAAAEQVHLSTLDLEDRRTGATRTRSNIRNFFYNGATVRGWVGPGPNAVFGNADDQLLATGETLSQVQSRVLGVGVAAAPLYTSIPAYVTFSVRGGIRFGSRTELVIDVENIGDRNYRGIAWGVDAPGRGLSITYQTRF